jgi:hypothetical protein
MIVQFFQIPTDNKEWKNLTLSCASFFGKTKNQIHSFLLSAQSTLVFLLHSNCL